MPYKVTSVALTRGHAANALTVEAETATEAWEVVNSLRQIGERVTIRHPDGYALNWLDLEALADAEQLGD